MRTVRLMLTLIVVSAVAASAQTAAVQPAPPFGPRVKPGSRVFVIDWTGAERKGDVRSISGDGLELEQNGRRMTIPRDAIARIEKTDGLWNGTLIGAGVGAGGPAPIRWTG